MSKTFDLCINNYTEKELETLRLWEPEVSRLVVAHEIGDKKKTHHLQIRVTFKRTYRFAAIKKLLPRARIEKTKATADSLYCLKSDSVEILINVDNRAQGQKFGKVIEDVKNGASKKELWDDHPELMIRYSKGIYDMMEFYDEEDHECFDPESFQWKLETDHSKCIVFWGESGIGKTEFAKAHFKNPKIVTDVDELAGFDSKVHDGIIFDDMSFLHLPREIQIHMTDKSLSRAIRCRYKNAKIPKNTKKIFTTNNLNGAIFDIADTAISRRIRCVQLCDQSELKGNTSTFSSSQSKGSIDSYLK